MIPTPRYLIKGGRLIDPAAGRDEVADLRLAGGKIVEKFKDDGGVIEIDAAGLIVCPGFIDVHTHLREPGREDEETIVTGARAAAAGGFTTIACMPNTEPPIDSAALVGFVREQARKAVIDVKVVGAVSRGRRGEELADLGEMAAAGAVAFSDDGSPVMSSSLMRAALEYARVFDLPIISHAEDTDLTAGGSMNEGIYSTMLGLTGMPSAAEEIIVGRDISLARLTNGRLHLAHISTAGALEMVRAAKKTGLRVTSEVTPHHLTLADNQLMNYDANYKINPPLRGAVDIEALWRGLADGTVDIIATDHAPHAAQEKDMELETAAFGAVGLETALPVVLTAAIERGLKLSDMIAKLTINPARFLGLNSGTLTVGADADVLIFNNKAKVKIEPEKFYSRSRNTPFADRELQGRVIHLFKAGKWVVNEGKVGG